MKEFLEKELPGIIGAAALGAAGVVGILAIAATQAGNQEILEDATKILRISLCVSIVAFTWNAAANYFDDES